MTQLGAFQHSTLEARTASKLRAFNRGIALFGQVDFAIMILIDESSQYEDNVGDFTRDLRRYDGAVFGFVRPSVRELFLGVLHIESFDGGHERIQPRDEDVFAPGGSGGSMVRVRTARPPTVSDMFAMFERLTPRFTDTNDLHISLKLLIDVSDSLNPEEIGPIVGAFERQVLGQYGQRVDTQAMAFGDERWLDAARRILPGL